MALNESVNDTFFSGIYKEVWRKLIPAGLSEAEAQFIEDVTHLTPEASVLDIMCGYGRHSVPLARKGYHITAVDNERDYIAEIKDKAAAEQLPIDASVQHVVSMQLTKKYDAAICMGNSFSFFNEEQVLQILAKLHTHLNTGGYFVINTWMIAEIALRNFQSTKWDYVDELKYLTESKYFFNPSRIESKQFIIAPNGHTDALSGIDYIFSISELTRLLNRSGFQLKDVFSTPRKRKFTLGDSQAYIVAVKS